MRISDWSSDVCSSDLDPRVGNAAQMRIELQSSVLHRDLPGGQVEAAEIGTTPGSMNDEIAGDLQVRRSLARGTHLQAVPVPLDPCDRGAGLDANAERREPRCEPEIGRAHV